MPAVSTPKVSANIAKNTNVAPAVAPAGNAFANTAKAQNGTPPIGGEAQGGLSQAQIDAGNANASRYSNDPNVNPNANQNANQSANKTNITPGGVGADGGSPAADAPSQSQNPDQNNQGSQVNAIISNLQTAGNITPEEQALREQIAQNTAGLGLGLANIANNPEGMQLQTGQSNVLQQQGLAKGNYLSSQLANLQAQRAASLQSQTAAGGLAAQEQGYQQQVTPVSPGNSLYSNFSGKQVGGNGDLNSLGGSAGGFLDSLAQDVASGNVSYDDAVKQLPSSAQSPALLQAIKRHNPGFSITTSNQNAQTRGSALQQQSADVRPLVASQQTAIQHLDNLQGILSKINYSNIPIVNGVRDWFSNTVSKDPNIAQAQSELNVVRSEVAKVLGGGSVTVESQHEAETVVPTDISPENFQSVADNVKNLMQSKITQATGSLNNVQQYQNGNVQGNNGVNTGQGTGNQTNGSSNSGGWASLGD